MLRNAVAMGGCQISLKKRYEDLRFNVISITRGWVGGCRISRKNSYVTAEWPLISKEE